MYTLQHQQDNISVGKRNNDEPQVQTIIEPVQIQVQSTIEPDHIQVQSTIESVPIEPGLAQNAQFSHNFETKYLNLQSLLPAKKRKIEIIEEKFFIPMEVQTELTSEDINFLFQHYQESVEERSKLLLRISTLVIDYDFFKGNDKKVLFYTGLPTWKLLDRFFKLVDRFLPEHGNCKLSPFQMLVLTLIKLRLNLTFTDLAYRFEIDITTASRYFHRCISILSKIFQGSKFVFWPTDRQNLLNNTPSYFRSYFKEAVTIIIDCFEIFIQSASVLLAASQAWSQYKHHATIKYLIGISTTGAILFVSKGFGGRTSDKAITNRSGFLNFIQEGDFVLADKGFLIEDEISKKKASLRIPCFVKKGGQLLPEEVEETRQTANLRIHVERVIRQLRGKFNMCSDTARMTAVSKQNELFDKDLYDKIIFVCSCLVNMCPSVVPSDFEC